MRLVTLVLALLAGLGSARLSVNYGQELLDTRRPGAATRQTLTREQVLDDLDVTRRPQYLTQKTKKFLVNGTRIPNVDFNVGESYAGQLPTSAINDYTNQLFFWFFPTTNPSGKDDIIIWMNGGPGCSSLEGFLQENGPFLWQYGTFKPVPNQWSWTKLANMIWVEQPVGTGFSRGSDKPRNEREAAAQFLGFWKNLLDTFPKLKGKKIYIAGESYAGYYVPYFAEAMIEKNNKNYYNIKDIMVYDAVMSSDFLAQQIPITPYVNKWKDIFGFNDSYIAHLNEADERCGFKKYRETYLTFPPVGKLPPAPEGSREGGCDVWTDVFRDVQEINPCFDMYMITTTCPLLYDVLGFPGSFDYVPIGAPKLYFDRDDVRNAINAPTGFQWKECANTEIFRGGADQSEPSSFSVLPKVMDRLNRTVIVHGQLDFILMPEGSVLTIQNMTWRGQQGFQTKPKERFWVPPHARGPEGTLAGFGDFGVQHTERGLTYVEVRLSGHMGPQYTPSASYRIAEFWLGRINDLSG